ncbi:MAG: hypothetical protein FWC47_03095 [Oscillospiraceae bacterium]|nr:hypothetical protein [Oscillospiraceae bacterium]
MKIQGNPEPGLITITFEDGEFKGKSLTMEKSYDGSRSSCWRSGSLC